MVRFTRSTRRRPRPRTSGRSPRLGHQVDDGVRSARGRDPAGQRRVGGEHGDQAAAGEAYRAGDQRRVSADRPPRGRPASPAPARARGRVPARPARAATISTGTDDAAATWTSPAARATAASQPGPWSLVATSRTSSPATGRSCSMTTGVPARAVERQWTDEVGSPLANVRSASGSPEPRRPEPRPSSLGRESRSTTWAGGSTGIGRTAGRSSVSGIGAVTRAAPRSAAAAAPSWPRRARGRGAP